MSSYSDLTWGADVEIQCRFKCLFVLAKRCFGSFPPCMHRMLGGDCDLSFRRSVRDAHPSVEVWICSTELERLLGSNICLFVRDLVSNDTHMTRHPVEDDGDVGNLELVHVVAYSIDHIDVIARL